MSIYRIGAIIKITFNQKKIIQTIEYSTNMEVKREMMRISLSIRLGIIFLFLLLPVVGMMSYFNYQSEENLAYQVSDTLEELMKQNNKLIETELDRITQVTTSLIMEETTQNIGKQTEVDPILSHYELRKLNTLLRNESFLDPSELNYYMVFPNQASNQGNKMEFFTVGDEEVPSLKEEDLQKWYESVTEDFGSPTLTPLKINYKETLAFLRSINDLSYYGSTLGMIVVSDIQNVFLENLGNTVSFDIEPYLLNEDNQILFGKKQGLTEATLKEALAIEANDFSTVVDNHIYVHSNNEKYGYTLLFQVPIETLTERQKQLTRNVIMITVLYFIFAFIIAFYLARNYVLPLQKLTIFFRSYLPGHVFNDPTIQEREGEVYQLMSSVQDMSKRMKKLMIDKYQAEMKYKEMELNRLQEQINPHLLYNTLESIQWNSIMNEDFETASMVNDLSALMKLGLSKGRDLITLKEEHDHLTAYTNLQKKRFDHPFAVEIEINEELFDCLIPKITLQPLVENSIKYGVKQMGEEGVIRVTSHLEQDQIIIKVVDNGFKEIDVEAINQSLRNDQVEENQGVGILNVNRRITYHFGKEYGLTYIRTEDGWTEVTILIPRVKKGEEKDVSDSDRG